MVAIKEASGDTRRLTDLINAVGDRYLLFAGLDDLALESALLGASGTVFGFVCAAPEETLRMWELVERGAWAAARAIYRWFMPLLHRDDHPKLVQYLKLAAQERGWGSERVRPPRLPLGAKSGSCGSSGRRSPRGRRSPAAVRPPTPGSLHPDTPPPCRRPRKG